MQGKSAGLLVLAVIGVGVFLVSPNVGAAQQDGALDIRIHPAESQLTPAAELLLTDPENRKAGRDARTGKNYSDIPFCSYETESIADAVSGSPGPATRVLDVRKPIRGEYSLVVTGTKSAPYSLEIRGYDLQLNLSDMAFLDVKISKGEVHEYRIGLPSEAGRKVTVRRIR